MWNCDVPNIGVESDLVKSTFKFYGLVNSFDDVEEPEDGTICILNDSACPYVYANSSWLSIDSDNKYCDASQKILPKNCINCGAILHGHICEYCGTEY